jgi:hypothetical protein
MKLFLDDFRQPTDCIRYMAARLNGYSIIYADSDWVVVKNYAEFVEAVKAAGDTLEIVSFDHDLADEHYDPDKYGSETYDEVYDSFEFKTGYDCAKWMIQHYQENNWKLPKILVHSMNPAGTENIKSLFKNLQK